jgi:hypothetical protein
MAYLLSKSVHGKVVKTSGSGYSVKLTFKKLKEIVKTLPGVEITDCNVAKTGTSYLDFEHNGIQYSIRVSNHSKRNWDDCFEPKTKIEIEEVEFATGGRGRFIDFEILNTETKHIFFAYLKNL